MNIVWIKIPSGDLSISFPWIETLPGEENWLLITHAVLGILHWSFYVWPVLTSPTRACGLFLTFERSNAVSWGKLHTWCRKGQSGTFHVGQPHKFMLFPLCPTFQNNHALSNTNWCNPASKQSILTIKASVSWGIL